MTARDIRVAPVSRTAAEAVIKKHHYAGNTVNNSQLHLGVFLGEALLGAMQFGPSMDKRKVLGLVPGTSWDGCLELNRMAFGPELPRNSESRALGVALRMIKKNAPQVKWVVSFADGTQCGDGTIYRAAGFVLTKLAPNKTLWQLPAKDGAPARVCSNMTLTKGQHVLKNGGAASMNSWKALGAKPLAGFQFRYIYFLDPTFRARLTCSEIPYSRIQELGAGMYLGQKRVESSEAAPGVHPGEDGATPISTLQIKAGRAS